MNSRDPKLVAAPSVRELLIQALKLIEKPENWCRSCYAMTRHNACACNSPGEAEKWCAVGALCHVGMNKADAYVLLHQHLGETFVGNVARFNDHTNHAGVLALYDRAIAACGVAS